jgi:hypothetical protein
MAGSLSVRALLATAAIITIVLASSARAGDLRDPMRPATIPASTISRPSAIVPLKLEAVMSSAHSRLAIVDGKVVRTGDHVSGALITEITADSIRYSRGGKEQTALLPTNKVTVRVNNTLQAGTP